MIKRGREVCVCECVCERERERDVPWWGRTASSSTCSAIWYPAASTGHYEDEKEIKKRRRQRRKYFNIKNVPLSLSLKTKRLQKPKRGKEQSTHFLSEELVLTLLKL